MKKLNKLAALALLAALVGCGGGNESSKVSSPAPSSPSVSTPDSGAADLDYLKTVAKTLVYSGWSTDGVRGNVDLITSLDDGNVSVSYTTNNTEVAAVDGGKLVITLPAEGTTSNGYVVVTVTATLTYKGQTTTKDFLLKVHEALAASTIADIHATTQAASFEIKGTVTVVNAKGFTVYDGTGHILVYQNKTPEVKVGDYVKVSGTTTFYQNIAQYDSSASVVVLDEVAPAEAVFDFSQAPVFYGPAELAAWDADGAKIGAYVTIKGTLNVSGSYYNVIIDGTDMVGSLSYPAADSGFADYNGKVIEATGFLLYKSGGKYANLMTTEVKEATLGEAEMAAAVKQTLSLPASVTDSLTLPATGAYDATISWSSANTAAITVNADGSATVTQGTEAVEVVLTATITVGQTTVTKDITVTVKALDANAPVLVTAPVAGTAYKLMSVQGNLDNKPLYITGEASGTYLATTDNPAEAADVVLVAVEGGFHLSAVKGGVTKFINIRSEYNEEKQKTYTNIYVEDAGSTVYTYDAELNTLVTVIGDNTFYLGTYNSFETFSASNVSYASTSFVSHLYTVNVSEEAPAEDGALVTAPEVGVAYKLMMNNGGNLYLTGEASGNYMASTSNGAEAADVVLVATEGGYHVSVLVGGATKYLNLEGYVNSKGTQCAYIRIQDAASTVWSFNTSINSLTGVVEGVEFYMGTYNDFLTFSASNVSYASSSVVSHLYTGVVAEEPKEETPEAPAPELPEATKAATISFADVANRTEFSTSKQVWVSNGVTVTNEQGSSTSAVADYSNPARFYKSSNLNVEYTEEIVMLVFTCAYTDKAFVAADSIPGATLTVDSTGLVCTLVLNTPATSFSITGLPRQIRVNSIEVYTA